jgi:hypothetical protein
MPFRQRGEIEEREIDALFDLVCMSRREHEIRRMGFDQAQTGRAFRIRARIGKESAESRFALA